MRLIKETNPVAREDHACDGLDQIDRWVGMHEFSIELHHIVKGEKYINQTCVDGGRLYNWRSCAKCNEIIVKNEIWEH